MYLIKRGTDFEDLRKYGFRLGSAWPNYERFIRNEDELSDFWLVPTLTEDGVERVEYVDEDFDIIPVWELRVNKDGKFFISCSTWGNINSTNSGLEDMFYILYKMIMAGIIEDDMAKG